MDRPVRNGTPSDPTAAKKRRVAAEVGSSQLSNLGFDLPDEAWLDLVRESESVTALGRIGPYELLEEISRGAQGIVYRARQQNTRRTIALKRLLAGSFATASMRSRFEREVEAASSLNHANIVTVYGMEFVDGQPLLAMEWVDGCPVDEWSRGNSAKPPDRLPDLDRLLQAFIQICEGVHHAHLRGVIHRDLKPSNILIDSSGKPRVLDFGLAKLTTIDDSAAVGLTLTRDFVGTPAFASPEQVRGDHDAVDVRSDVYALGVILYQMLSGKLPYPPDRNLPDLLQAIQHTEPDRPSSIRQELNREIDVIVLKALSKDAADRYQSVDALADDVRRYRSGEAVLAHPPGSMYQLRKMVGRHRLAFAFATTVFILVLAFGIVAAVLAFQLAEKHREAQTQAAIAQAVNDFLNDDLLRAVDPERTPNPAITVREVLDAASERTEGRFANDPLVRASIHETLGSTYRRLGLYETARGHLERSANVRTTELGPDHPSTLSVKHELAILAKDRGRYDEAKPVLFETLQRRRRTLGPNHEKTLSSMVDLASLYFDQGRYDEATELYEETLENQLRVLGKDHLDTLRCMNNLAALHQKLGRYGQAEQLYVDALDAQRGTHGEEHPFTLGMMNNLADLYRDQGRLDEAEKLFAETLRLRRRVLGEDHPDALLTMHNLASLYVTRRRLEEAQPLLEETLEIRRRILGEEHPETLNTMQKLGQLHNLQTRREKAEPLLARALEIRRRVQGEEHPDTLSNMIDLAYVYNRLQRRDEAEQLYLRALEIQRRILGEDHPDTLTCMTNLAVLYDAQRRYAESEPLHAQALEVHRRANGPDHALTLISMSNLANARTMLGRPEEAEPLHAAAVAAARTTLPEGHWHTGMYLRRHGQCLLQLGRFEESEKALQEAHQIFATALGPNHKQTIEVIRLLVELYESRGDPDRTSEWRAKLMREDQTE